MEELKQKRNYHIDEENRKMAEDTKEERQKIYEQ